MDGWGGGGVEVGGGYVNLINSQWRDVCCVCEIYNAPFHPYTPWGKTAPRPEMAVNFAPISV